MFSFNAQLSPTYIKGMEKNVSHKIMLRTLFYTNDKN